MNDHRDEITPETMMEAERAMFGPGSPEVAPSRPSGSGGPKCPERIHDLGSTLFSASGFERASHEALAQADSVLFQ